MTIKPVLVPDHTANDLRKLMDHFATAAQSATPAAQANRIRQQLQEARPDVMRHAGDKTIKIVKRAGKPIGEIGTDAEASPGNGQYYVKLYDGSYDAVGFDSAEEALAELKYAIKSAGSGSDTSFGGPGGWTGPLSEFAPSTGGGDDGDDGFDEDTLRQLAAKWYQGDEDPRVEQVLMAAGWEIGQDEGYEDEPGVFVVMSGDEHGKSYISWPASELQSDVAEQGVAEGVKKMSPQQQHDFDRMRYGAMSRKEYDAKWKKPLKSDDEVIYGKKKGVTEARNNVSVPAALEMLKDARAYLDQFDPEDDDDYFDAYETIAAEFDMESNDSSNDPLTDLLDMYEVNPQQAAQALADHLQSQSKDVTEQQVDELSPKTLGSYIKKSSADAAERQGEVTGRNQFGKGAEFAVKAFYGDKIKPNAKRDDPKIAKRQAGIGQAVDRLTAEDVAESIDPVEQLRADILRFSR
jgi:hypothetical protein